MSACRGHLTKGNLFCLFVCFVRMWLRDFRRCKIFHCFNNWCALWTTCMYNDVWYISILMPDSVFSFRMLYLSFCFPFCCYVLFHFLCFVNIGSSEEQWLRIYSYVLWLVFFMLNSSSTGCPYLIVTMCGSLTLQCHSYNKMSTGKGRHTYT